MIGAAGNLGALCRTEALGDLRVVSGSGLEGFRSGVHRIGRQPQAWRFVGYILNPKP